MDNEKRNKPYIKQSSGSSSRFYIKQPSQSQQPYLKENASSFYIKRPLSFDITLGITTTDQQVQVSDEVRQSGTYILGIQGRGKSSLLEQIIYQDICKGYAVIVLDPHGDLIDHALAQLPANRLQDTYLLDMTDVHYPFGVNLLAASRSVSTIERIQTVDRVMHVFEALWEDVLKQQYLPRYLRAGILALLENEGTTLVNLYDFLVSDTYRENILANVRDESIQQFWQLQYNNLSKSERKRETATLVNRLEALFMGRPLIRNILGQSNTTIDFRRAIEQQEILFIKLPIQTLKQDASLIGTMLIAQIHAAIFSFANIPLQNRPTYSIFIDEFQHFVTADIEEIYTGGRKFGSRLCVAHQIREQLPRYLAKTTIGAQTIICFQTTHEDASDMAPLFTGMKRKARDFAISPLAELDDHPNIAVKEFWRDYIAKLETAAGKKVFYPTKPAHMRMKDFNSSPIYPRIDFGYGSLALLPWQAEKALELLDRLFLESEKQGQVHEPLKREVLEATKPLFMEDNYSTEFQTAAERAGHETFIRRLTQVLTILVAHPITADSATLSNADIARELQRLAQRQAYVKIGAEVSEIRTNEIPSHVSMQDERRRQQHIREQTRATYCRPVYKVEQEIRQRLEAIELDEEEEPTSEVLPVWEDDTAETKREEPAPEIQREPEPPQPEPILTSMDRLNMLSAQMKAKEIDPDTAILAALGETYVLTIKQWMRLFSWGSYPRATTYFKQLREQGYIFHKDREGRGGKLVEGDWFFLLTKGANELVKRKQAKPTFRVEPNEIEKSSGDTLLHTYLVNELLIQLRLLERTRPDSMKIEQLDHERSMRRQYLDALGNDAKIYPDGFLRLLVPTQNGLKRKYLFLELQYTTQKDKANWQAKVRKYLDLFTRIDILEKFFHTRTPQVLVITIDAEYAAYHKQWTEEVLAGAGEKGRGYSNRFVIGTFDQGSSGISTEPLQFFCTPRFSVPFQEGMQPLFTM